VTKLLENLIFDINIPTIAAVNGQRACPGAGEAITIEH